MSEQAESLASDEPTGPGYRTGAPKTRGEAELTAGVKVEPGTIYGFFTDSTVCIGCKACEVACKQWNQLPMDDFGLKGTSYDNTGELGATTWRHVAFVEDFPVPWQGGAQKPVADGPSAGSGQALVPSASGPSPAFGGAAGHKSLPRAQRGGLPYSLSGPAPATGVSQTAEQNRWLFLSDVCKHCERAGCLEACPTGAIVRTEFGSVLVQQDVCNGCHYCVPSCPFGVIAVADELDRKAHKCTLCYDRLKAGLEPACAKACPTDSIQFGPVGLLRERARRRVAELHARGQRDAYLYGVPDSPKPTGSVGGLNCFFLLTAPPEAYNLPAAPELPSRRVVPASLTSIAAALLWGAVVIAAIRRWR